VPVLRLLLMTIVHMLKDLSLHRPEVVHGCSYLLPAELYSCGQHHHSLVLPHPLPAAPGTPPPSASRDPSSPRCFQKVLQHLPPLHCTWQLGVTSPGSCVAYATAALNAGASTTPSSLCMVLHPTAACKHNCQA
jgi:hypothetical protein